MAQSESTIQIADETMTLNDTHAIVRELIAALGSGEADDIRQEIDPYLCTQPLGGFVFKDYITAAFAAAERCTSPEEQDFPAIARVFGHDFGEQVVTELQSPGTVDNKNIEKFLLASELKLGRRLTLEDCQEWQY